MIKFGRGCVSAYGISVGVSGLEGGSGMPIKVGVAILLVLSVLEAEACLYDVDALKV